MSVAENMVLLEAGAVLPVGAPVAKDDTVDALTTRAYSHPVLEGRTVVRLVPAAVGAAEDLSMEFLGFAQPAPVNEVGLVRQQALGFPAWALVHDPANGHHALALVKEIEKFARTAKSRIGPAKEGFDALGERLARAVPHFLPTFYEEAGRAFLAADSTSYAATMFGKAREAERVFALRIDEERQHTVFLEFALAGALTAKALTQHARELAARSTPAEAYERFLRLCVERTLGGLPPYAAMHTDLRRLAKAAKLDQAEADRDVLAQLLPAPALIRASESFWNAYSVALAQLAAADPALRGRLLGMFPQNCTDDTWLGVLEQAGATASLTEPAGAVPAEALPSDGPAGWLARFDEHRQRRYWRDRKRSAKLLALVERMAPRLKADGTPVAVVRRSSGTDLDLLDACLALGVPVADPENTERFGVNNWLNDEHEGRRELVAVAADTRFLKALANGVENHLDSGYRMVERVREVTAVPGLRTAMHHWLERLAADRDGHGLPALGGHFDKIAQAACPEGAAVNEAAMARLLGHDVAGTLAHTLRTGVLDEFGWPALEEAVARLTGDGDISVTDQWPHLILNQGDLVLVVGEQGVELEHIVRIPADQRRWMYRTVFRYVDRQLLVCWDIGRERSGYWSGAPDDVFTVPDEAFQMYHTFSLPITGGGRTAGARPLHVGDRSERRGGRVFTDGSAYWVLVNEDGKVVCREFDPATGEHGRASLPSFFEDGTPDGQHLAHHSCWLSVRDNGEQLGWRVRRDGTGTQYGQALDGTTYTMPGSATRRGELSGAICFPGAERTSGVTQSRNWRNTGLSLYDADGRLTGDYSLPNAGEYARGTDLVPTPAFWHLLRPRDEAGSAALRTLTDEQAAALLAEAVRLTGQAAESDDDDADKALTAALETLVARELPAITDLALRAGVAGIVRVAATLATRLAGLADSCAGNAAVAAPTPTGPSYAGEDRRLAAALSGLMPYCYARGDSATRMLTAVGAALTGADQPTGQLDLSADDDWFDALGVLPAAMYRAAAPFTDAEHRETLAELLSVIAGSGLLAPGGRLRWIELKSDQPVTDGMRATVRQVGNRRLLVLSVDTDDKELTALDYAPDGVFGAVPGHAITRERAYHFSGITPDAIAAFTKLLTERGPVAWRPERVADLSARAGVSLAEAAMLLAGLPSANWSRAESEPLREQIGVPDGDIAAAAARRVGAGGRAGTARQLSRLMPADPAALWETGPDLERFAEAWIERHGRRKPVRDELIVAIAQADVDGSMNASELIHGIANPDSCKWLAGTADGIDDEDVLVALAKCVPWLAYHLPADDPIRSVLPRAAELARTKLADPKLSLPVGWVTEKKTEPLLNATGRATVTEADGGFAAGALHLPPDTGYRAVHLRTALLDGADDPALHLVQARLDSHDEGTLAALRAVLGGQLARLAGYPVPLGVDGYAQDPSRSAPELVAQVAAKHGLTDDAAVLYLQLLALPDPTDRNVAMWTGWKPARLKAARAALTATDLVVEAKRPRAGRSLFLPGGWHALKAPHLPLERWKLPLLIGGEQGVSGLGIVLPVAPAPQLFTLAWERITQGDGPRFDELVTGRPR
ncbi:hypothetical protein ACFQY4_33005 [Catellatospora bangladeshensis]|uniref:DNA-binding protein n=1 Tax=Catellatospora bangladeshensis TaxID=310355 RepID=A0A8J3JXC2_9ACTN|nr:hypothetical protein [Catellatospora bangladeshensis]GIF84819.1 hypothetical protein Cba03nite_61680 [Catellatospora bangladeshensis]